MATFPARGPTSEAHKAVIAQLLDRDDELRQLAREYLLLGMQETINQLRRGDPATRSTIARALASTITKAITEPSEEDGNESLRAEMHEMMAEMTADIMGNNSSPRIVPKVRKRR